MSASERLVAIVLTLNESEHLPGCLQSLALVTDTVIVLDSGSNDGTQAIAAAHDAELRMRVFDGYANQRNAALELAGDAEWVLFLDADERITANGAVEIRAAVADTGLNVAVCWLPRRNIFFGRELRGGGWWPDYQARLLRRDRSRFEPARQVHEVVQFDGESRYLTEPIVHLNYASRREFVVKQRAYTRQRVAQAGTIAIPRRRAYIGAPAREFARRVIRLKGYRDGPTGLFVAGALAVEEGRAVWLMRSKARRT